MAYDILYYLHLVPIKAFHGDVIFLPHPSGIQSHHSLKVTTVSGKPTGFDCALKIFVLSKYLPAKETFSQKCQHAEESLDVLFWALADRFDWQKE